jgi:hypothetical protein
LFGWGEGYEACKKTTFANRYVVEVELSTNNNRKQLNITSPLIPDACKDDTVSQDNADSAEVLKVTC